VSTLLAVLFWLAVGGVAYTYVGYGLIISLLARWRERPVIRDEITPTVTLLVAAYNEESCIASKIANTLLLAYPPDKLDLLVVADGSTDRTAEIVAACPDPRVRVLHAPERRGKAAALIRALPHTTGEVVVFSDANSLFSKDALHHLVRAFADPTVGAVSGVKRILNRWQAAEEQGENLYWRYEAWLKRCDSAVGSVMGVPGEIWAARRDAWVAPEPTTLLDDFVSSLRMVEAGWRVVFEPAAVATEEASPGLRAEWTRRVRNAAGGWQAFGQLTGLLRHPSPLVTWQYLSHRMLRWMVAPLLFVVAAVTNLALLGAGPAYRVTGALQLAFYLTAVLGWLLSARNVRLGWLLAPFYVCLLNAAALVGGWRCLRGQETVLWRKAR
jgi:cellulose synthase/poly-beta-1,6-N-acetylglucosamine synthase-like glycosyltransferase